MSALNLIIIMNFITDEVLEDLLYSDRRRRLFKKVRQIIQDIAIKLKMNYKELKIGSEGYFIPIIYGRKKEAEAPLLLVIGAQHNEYNGTFGMLNFLKADKVGTLLEWQEKSKGGFCFIPLLNVRGFLNPILENKWGYFVQWGRNPIDGSLFQKNSNRFWAQTIEWDTFQRVKTEIPEENRVISEFLFDLREISLCDTAPFIVLDFHETSLPYRTRKEMADRFSANYPIKKSWITQLTYEAALHYNNRPYCYTITPEIAKSVRRALLEMNRNIEDTTFFLCAHSRYSKKMAEYIAHKLQERFAAQTWYWHQSILDHETQIKGCFVSANVHRPWMCAIEVESRKLFFDLSKERQRREKDPFYRQILLKLLDLNANIASYALFHALQFLKKKNRGSLYYKSVT